MSEPRRSSEAARDRATNQARRVLLLTRGGELHGAQRQLWYLVRGLDRSRYEPIVVLDQPGALAENLHHSGIETHVLPMHAWRSFPAGMLRYWDASRIAWLARRRRVSIVHASDVWRSEYMRFAAWLAGAASVLHVRGPMARRDVRKHHATRARGVIAIARRYQQDLLAFGVSPDRLELIDDAVDLEQFRPGLTGGDYLRKRFGVDGRVFVGLVGRLEPFKRVVEFLEAIAPLARDSDGRAAFLLIGQPGPEPYHQIVLEAVERLGLRQRVAFTGHCDDIPETIAALDVLVTMSGGSVMFEAMACAKPVLSVPQDERHSEHTRDGKTAVCVTTERPAPATAALAKLIDDADLRERLGRAGRAYVEQHLSVATMVTKTQALYDRLLER